jgi:hypothetical protein
MLISVSLDFIYLLNVGLNVPLGFSFKAVAISDVANPTSVKKLLDLCMTADRGNSILQQHGSLIVIAAYQIQS